MIRSFLLVLFLPMPAWSEVVSIRSGEHDTFSRLVLSIEAGIDWNVSQTDGGAHLILDEHIDGFDVSQVFERIPRDRLRELEQVGPGTLALDFSCNCSVETFLWRSDRLVLDLVENPGGVDSIAPIVMFDSLDPDTIDLMGPIKPNTALPDVAILANGLSLTGFSVELNSPVEAELLEFPEATQSEDIALSEVALLEGIARAASQGFLIPNVHDVTLEPVPAPSQSAKEVEPIQTSSVEVDTGHPQPGIDISTALEQSLSDIGSLLSGSVEQRCLPTELFNISDWGNGAGFHEQVAQLSEALAGEFGEEPVDAETDLARLYLYYGFGPEALTALTMTQTASQSRQVLTELALLFDETQSNLPLLKSQRGCETAGALWAFLAAPMELETASQTNGITRAFFELPQPLRGYIAPKLSQAFLSIDMPDSAESVLRASENRDSDKTPIIQTTRALIAEQNEDPTQALTLLTEQSNDTVRMSPQAAMRLVTLTLEQGGIPAEPDLILLSALTIEFDTQDISDEIETVEATGWAARGEYLRAFEIIADRSDEAAELTRDQIYLELTENGPSDVFLELIMNNRFDDLSTATENAMARRLMDLGFPDHAQKMVSGVATRAQGSERRYLRAEAALELEDYSKVIATLEGMNDERSRSLRAAAYSGLGDYRNAMESLAPNQIASAAELQFRAGAWERLTLEDDAILSDFAKTVVTEMEPEAAITLQDRRSLLAHSQESRRAVEGLLLRFDGNPASNE